jgi:N-acylglucosamine 2-epimerase
MSTYAALYHHELFHHVLPFWINQSIDKIHGGYFTCLNGNGEVFDTDKFIWLQCRQVWTFSMLTNRIENPDPIWLKTAEEGAKFLLKHGRDRQGNWYFSLRMDGQPLVAAYNIFSDCFACMAFAQLFKATGKTEYEQIAKETFFNILKRKENPKGIFNKVIGETRPLKNFALPMILCNLALEIEHLLEKNMVDQIINDCINEVMIDFYDSPSGLTLENVNPNGQLSDSFEGRLLNPGHAIEAMWFVMDLAHRINDKSLLENAIDRGLKMIAYGWDDEFGGIFYFLDRKGHPPQQLEWDQKLWWVHLETLVFLTKSMEYTNSSASLPLFKKIHDYTWNHFRDDKKGEWWGYLNRRGEVLLDLKGGKWKGCFHVPRALFMCSQSLKKLNL